MKTHPVVEYSPYRDNLSARTVTEMIILSPHGSRFVEVLDSIRAHCHHPEKIAVQWWTDQNIYIEVIDARFGAFPASLRLLITFDLGIGAVVPANNCSRAGWHRFNTVINGSLATKYKSAATFMAKLEGQR